MNSLAMFADRGARRRGTQKLITELLTVPDVEKTVTAITTIPAAADSPSCATSVPPSLSRLLGSFPRLPPHLPVHHLPPHSALFVPDDDAMKFYNAISFFAKSHLHPAGRLLLEINEAYKDEVCSLLEKENFINIEPFKDINNKWRIVKAQKA